MHTIARLKRKLAGNLLAAAVCALLVFGVPFLERKTAPEIPSPAAGRMALYIFDVGQGDAILAQEGDRQILIDGGPDDSILERLGAAMPEGDRTIDLIILTHPHADHLDGLVAVLERYTVGRIMVTDVSAPTSYFRRWKEMIAEKAVLVDDPQAVGEERVADMRYEVLAAGTEEGAMHSKHDGNSDGLNDTSIVGSLEFGSRRFLLMGDATTAVEKGLLKGSGDMAADFLKVGHHGSTYSTGDEFVSAASPPYSVISVGAKNTYGNPAWRVLKSLGKASTVLRTDLDGTVIALTDGQSLQVTAERL